MNQNKYGAEVSQPARGEEEKWRTHLDDKRDETTQLMKDQRPLVKDKGEGCGQGLRFIMEGEGGEVVPAVISAVPFGHGRRQNNFEQQKTEEENGQTGQVLMGGTPFEKR